MRRREFLAGLLLAATGRYAQAQEKVQPVAKAVRLGYLAPAKTPHILEAFRNGMRDLGYVEGRNLSIEYRFADGRPEILDALATELVQLAPDVIVAVGIAAAVPAKRATTTIPVVFAPAADPVRTGLVPSLARPGGNITGVTLFASELSQKRLEILMEAIPGLKHVAVLGEAKNPLSAPLLEDTKRAGEALGIDLRPLMVNGLSGLDATFAQMERDGIDAVMVLTGAVFDSGRHQIVRLAAEHRLAGMYEHRAFVEAGGLMSYGPNIDQMTYRAAAYVDKILKGAKPADLPIEQPSTFELFIDLNAAKALGLTIPQSILLRADEVIE